MKSCESCIFATATHGRFKTTLADGMTLTQNGGVNYICHHPGGGEKSFVQQRHGGYDLLRIRGKGGSMRR